MTGLDEADALTHLGRAALQAGDYEGAARHFAQAILVDSASAAAHVNMAAAHLALGRAEAAAFHARRATTLDPALVEGHHNLGNALFAQGNAADATASFRRARDLDPQTEGYWSNYLFALNFTDVPPQTVFEENRAWGHQVEKRLGAVARPRPVNPDPERPLRLAYYLPELETHVTPRFLQPLIAAHDRTRFHVSIYGARADGRAPPPELIPDGIRWIDIRGETAAATAARMRDDTIDVLVHPCTFKARYRVLLAHRAAPVQIAAINLVSTTGLAATDYLVSDAALTADEDRRFFCERLLLLPSFNTYRPPAVAPDVGPLPADAHGHVTFGTLNNPAKFSVETIAVWSALLNQVIGSHLLLKHRAFDDEATCQRMTDRFGAAGLAPGRLAFAGFTRDTHDYLATYHGIDIALDPLPFGGGTTSYEALWMGVPVLTVRGGHLMGRLSASLMHAVGQDDFVARAADDFIARGVRLAGDVARLRDIRTGLREVAAATIFDGVRFTRSLEAALRQAWRDAL